MASSESSSTTDSFHPQRWTHWAEEEEAEEDETKQSSSALHGYEAQRTGAHGGGGGDQQEHNDPVFAMPLHFAASLGGIDFESKTEEDALRAPFATQAIVSLPAITAGDPSHRKRRRYGQTRVSEDHKRERNRETFKRFYHKKQETLRALRLEEETLSQQCQQLLLTQTAPSATSNGEQRSLTLSTEKDRLLAEKTALEEMAEHQRKARCSLVRVLEASRLEDLEEETAQQNARFSFLKPTAPTNHTRDVQRAIHQLRSIHFDARRAKVSAAFGWRYRWQQHGEQIEFHVQKRFKQTRLSAAEIASRTWQFCTTTTSNGSPVLASPTGPSSRVCSRRIPVRLIDVDSTCAMYRTTTPSPRQLHQGVIIVAKSVYLVSKLHLHSDAETRRSFAVVSHSVDNPECYLQDHEHISLDDLEENRNDAEEKDPLRILFGATTAPPARREVWIDELSWWKIEDIPLDQEPPYVVDVSLTGRAPLCLELSSSAWFVEILRLAIHWEQVVMGMTPISCT